MNAPVYVKRTAPALQVCDHFAATCPQRCMHGKAHPHDSLARCKRGICGGEHVECKPVRTAAKP